MCMIKEKSAELSKEETLMRLKFASVRYILLHQNIRNWASENLVGSFIKTDIIKISTFFVKTPLFLFVQKAFEAFQK